LLPVALLIFLFFCTTVYSEKKNSVYREESNREAKFYNGDYKKRVAGSNRDIISYNKINQTEDSYEEYTDRKESIKTDTKKEKNCKKVNEKKKNSNQKKSEEFLYYIVKSGDTLFSISKKSKVSIEEIQDINNINENSKIFKGMKLKLPSDKTIRKTADKSPEKVSISSKPLFSWPLKKVKGCTRDGKDGVKPIGIIITGNPGGEVIASDNGVVKKVGYMRGYGKYIVVKHEKRYITVYSNLMKIDVKAGDIVRKGGRIGNISDDMTLHFQIDRGGKPENPLNLLPGRG